MGIRYSSSSRVDPRVGDMTEETPVPDINFSDVGATSSSSHTECSFREYRVCEDFRDGSPGRGRKMALVAKSNCSAVARVP